MTENEALREIQEQLDTIRKRLQVLGDAHPTGSYERMVLNEALYGLSDAKSNVDMACTWAAP